MATTLHSKQASISGVQKASNFGGHVFGGGISAKGAVFESLADFRGAVFHGPVDFSGAIFRDGADFAGAKFIPKKQRRKRGRFVSLRDIPLGDEFFRRMLREHG